MSGPPKRLHEEGALPTPLKRSHEEPTIYSTSGKPSQSVGNEFHLPVEHGQEGRLAKVQRVELRDSDKRPSLLHRLPTSSINSLEHPITFDNRSELKWSKDARDVRNENREVEADARELYNETRTDPQCNKGEIDVRVEVRGDDKEHKADRSSYCDAKFEKDNHSASSSHLNWKDNKDRGKRYYEPPSDGLDTWRVRSGVQTADEVPKDMPTSEERDSVEAHEAVGENRVEVKVEEKLRDKDRKRKDREFGEKDKDKSDWRNNAQLGGASGERKDLLREDRDVEKWERERKDVQKDKERNEKDPLKREPSTANEKDNSLQEKELLDGSNRNVEHDITTSESKSKKLKDDSWKPYDKDIKEKKREKDADLGERQEQSGRYHDKESDDGFVEGDGVTEKEKDAFGGVQKHRRMLRSRVTPQQTQRDVRFRSRPRDAEGSQGKSETSAILYKAGECMQELLKFWQEFDASQDKKSAEMLETGPTMEVRIPAEYVTSTNRQVKGAQLWGTDIYTNDSDLVAVLMHTGYCSTTSSSPPAAMQELRVTVRVLPPKNCYTSTLRNNVRSRAWGKGIGCSFRVERCCIVKKVGGTIELEPHLPHTSAVEPTLAPVSVERSMTTRAAASNALRHQRFLREVTIQYNLCNEPWLKYAINIVADKGLKKPLYTSARLKKGEVLYVETHLHRYELCLKVEAEHDKVHNHGSNVQNGDRNSSERESLADVFRWSRCRKAFPEKLMQSLGIPLPVEHLEILEDNLDWEDIQWSQSGVWVAGKEYALARVHFLTPN